MLPPTSEARHLKKLKCGLGPTWQLLRFDIQIFTVELWRYVAPYILIFINMRRKKITENFSAF
jgi:hypothetical protein